MKFFSEKATIYFIVLVVLQLLVPAFLYAGSENIQNEKIFLYAKPAVVRIGMSVSGTVRFPQLRLAQDAEGNIVILTTGNIAEEVATTAWTCSGFVVNPAGYIVTNAHCADASTETITDYVWAQFSYQLLAGLQARDPEFSATRVGQEVVNKLYNQILDFISQRGEFTSLTYWLTVFDPSRKEGTIFDFTNEGLQIEVKKMGQPFPQYGKDVAIVKITKENLVTVKLGDSRGVKPGNRVFVMGFPAVADLNEAGYIEPSFTAGIVSAVKKSSQGDYNVIQIDAAIAGGNSGGPVFNEEGEVIGIATFGATETQGFNWILPIELAQEFLKEINVANTSGITDERYQKGLDLFLKKRYSKAKEELEAVQVLHPSQAVAGLIAKANEAIAKGEERKFLFGLPPTVLISAGVVILLFIAIASYFIIRSIRRSKESLSGKIKSEHQ